MANASEIIDFIYASGVIITRISCTFVNVRFTIDTFVSRSTLAAVGVDQIGARPIVLTGSSQTFVKFP